MPLSPAGQGRAGRIDQALDRSKAGQDRNRNVADRQPDPDEDVPERRRTPNTGNGRVER
jgi:hypothetical protein